MRITMDSINKKSKKHEKENIYIGSNISREKEKNFRDINFFITDTDAILVLIDLTLVDSAKNAIAITKEGIFWNDDSNKEFDIFQLEWCDFFRAQLTISDENKLLFIKYDKNNYTINIGNSESSPNEILNLLLDLQALQYYIDEDQDKVIARRIHNTINKKKKAAKKNNKKEDESSDGGSFIDNAGATAGIFGVLGAKVAMGAIGTTATVVSAPVIASVVAAGAVGYGLSKLSQSESKKTNKETDKGSKRERKQERKKISK